MNRREVCPLCRRPRSEWPAGTVVGRMGRSKMWAGHWFCSDYCRNEADRRAWRRAETLASWSVWGFAVILALASTLLAIWGWRALLFLAWESGWP